MREIKFRAWDKSNKVWWSNYATGNALVLTQDKATGVVFQQFTGLKDKNGKEIYEGDIVRDEDSGQRERWWGVVALEDAPSIPYKGQKGTVVQVTKNTILVSFDNTAFGGGWFTRSQLRKLINQSEES